MASGLSMKVLLQLQTKQFTAGINQVKKEIRGLRNSFLSLTASLGAGLGLYNLISAAKDAAIKLSVVENMLLNVSESAREYAENMEFLKRISAEYGQDLIALAEGFAQFRAASKQSNLSLEEQRFIYEALTRAAGAYQLSSEATKNAMIAVTQMISKGKVTAEELRRQLGNSLPGAFVLMAKAAGMAGITAKGTTAELEDMMKKGKIIAEDVLPTFARVLNEVTQAASFNSLQSSINRLKNAWYEFVESVGVQDALKSLVSFLIDGLNWVKEHLNEIRRAVTMIISYFVSSKIYEIIANGIVPAVKNLVKGLKDAAMNGKLLAGAIKVCATWAITLVAEEKRFWNEQKRIREEQEKYNNLAKDVPKNIDEATASAEKTIKKAEDLYNIAVDVNKTEKERISATKQLQVLTGKQSITFENIKTSSGKIKEDLKEWANWIRISARSAAAFKLLEQYNEELIKAEETEKRLRDVPHADAVWFGGSYTNVQNQAGKEYVAAKNKIQPLKDAIKSLEELIKEEELFNPFEDEGGESQAAQDAIKGYLDNYKEGVAQLDEKLRRHIITQKMYEKGINKLRKDTSDSIQAIKGWEGGVEKLDDSYKALIDTLDDVYTGAGGGKGKNKTIGDVFSDYKKDAKELENQLHNGAISQSEYEDSMTDLGDKTWKSLAAFDNLEEKIAKLDETTKGTDLTFSQLANTIKNAFMRKELERQADATNEYWDKKLQELSQKTEQYDKKVKEILKQGVPTGETRETFFDYKKTGADILGEELSNQEKLVSELEKVKERLEEIREEFGALDPEAQKIFDKVIEKLKEAKDEAVNLKDKSNVAQWVEDVKKLKKELSDINYSSFKNLADSFDRLVRGSKNLADAWATLTDEKLDEQTEKFFDKMEAGLKILNEGIQLFELIRGVVDGLKKSEEAHAALKQAINSQQAIESATKIGMLQAEDTAAMKNAATVVAAEQMKEAAIEKTTGKQAAEAVVGAASSVASTPIIGPVLAGAAVAAMIALMAKAMGAFANGGIVGGNSTHGDHNIIRANSGELILTKGQQATLFNAIKSGNLGGGNVEFKIKGSDLIGTMKNYQSKIRG